MADDDFFIRRFARERDAGNTDAAREIWKQACVRQYDLVKGLVRAHRFPGGERLSREDCEDAEIEAMVRILKMGERFESSTAPQFRAAIKRAVYYACMDVGRRTMHYEMGIGGSLDDRYEDSEAGRFDAAVARFLGQDGDIVADAVEDAAEGDETIELVRWALAQIDNDNYRIVLELTFLEGLDGEQIAEQLDITLDNVYQRRKRGLQKLEAILRDHRP